MLFRTYATHDDMASANNNTNNYSICPADFEDDIDHDLRFGAENSKSENDNDKGLDQKKDQSMISSFHLILRGKSSTSKSPVSVSPAQYDTLL